MALVIYTEKINARKKYVFNHIFNSILGIDYLLIDDVVAFALVNSAKISYRKEFSNDVLNFVSHSIMDERGFKNQVFEDFNEREFKYPFKVENSVFGFDVFAASFLFLSRYEEYFEVERDEHQRFLGKNSYAYKNSFIQKPVIDEWAYQIAEEIKKHYPEFEIKPRKFKFLPTLDIDSAYNYQLEKLFKKVLKIGKLAVYGNFKSLFNDPYDIYDEVLKMDKKFGLKTTYFFLISNKHQYDSAVNISHPKFNQLIQNLSLNHTIGIHPSYNSYLNAEEVLLEKSKLAKIIGEDVKISRQHFLLLNFPKTYQILISAGIKEDFTMAYADVAGFRASTCTPFFWYDLKNENQTELLIHPTTVMDQTLRKYMNLTPNDSLRLIDELMENVKKVNGTFISLWHNESINNYGHWKGWKNVYVRMLEKASEKLKS